MFLYPGLLIPIYGANKLIHILPFNYNYLTVQIVGMFLYPRLLIPIYGTNKMSIVDFFA